jgi:DNA-binding PadR family transcriptional regulator
MILGTLEAVGPLHGYGIARRIEAASQSRLTLNYGTIHTGLVKLEQRGFVSTLAPV